ncbi:hypothetical protein [Marivita sp. GX14005]|uniref:hypothetical protein n=1 Tax=Marivita sp. GX14005 TaxID=2942276 RepID=UPI002019991A|nr:hypothetical protein [Marivita sp. GX14005]MCL3883354.1 hypothetical protein [Marivita sp. GX14005]
MMDILRLSLPLALWLASFSAVYGLHGLICSGKWASLGLTELSARAALLIATALAVAVQAALVFALRSPPFASPSPSLRRVSLTLAIVALIATGWTLFPAALMTMCGPADW